MQVGQVGEESSNPWQLREHGQEKRPNSPSKSWSSELSCCLQHWTPLLHHSCIYQPLRRHKEPGYLEGNKQDSDVDRNPLPSNFCSSHPRSDKWQADYFSCHCLDQGEWSLHSDVFNPDKPGIGDSRWYTSSLQMQQAISVSRTSYLCIQNRGSSSTGLGCSSYPLVSVQANQYLPSTYNCALSALKKRARGIQLFCIACYRAEDSEWGRLTGGCPVNVCS